MTARLLHHFAHAAALSALLTAACDDPAGPELADDDIGFRTGTGNGGPLFNTNKLWTSDVSMIDTTGLVLEGNRLVGVMVSYDSEMVTLDPGSLRVESGVLIGTGKDLTFTGTDFLGSLWLFDVGGQALKAKLTNVETSALAGLWDPIGTATIRNLDPERLVYTFQYIHPLKEMPVHTCDTDAVAGARMVLFGDISIDHAKGDVVERPNTIYFGCISGAPGKAALWGYAHDNPSLPSVELDAFETGIRVVRADYCADGDSYTLPGQELTLQDRWGINDHGLFPFTTEALWTVGAGAKCLNRIRETGLALAASHVCPNGKTIPLCSTLGETAVKKRWNSGTGDIWTRLP